MNWESKDLENIENFLDYLTRFVKNYLKEKGEFKKDNIDIPPLMFIVRNSSGDLQVILVPLESKEEIKKALSNVSVYKPRMVGLVLEGYANQFDAKTGEFKGRKEIIQIQVYDKNDKIMRMIDKFDMDNFIDGKDFDGYITINDIDRVFNFE